MSKNTNSMEAHLQFGEWGGPYQTVKAQGVKTDERSPRNPYASGYGKKIPTPYWVKYEGRWRRVYCVCYSNSGTNYVRIAGEDVVVSLT